ncbi:MAG: hypothetical protein KDA24_24845 [Deltaproteobacteria bacterium]|nr:hypothetical protein [Deltaproteobacteria bacterium]
MSERPQPTDLRHVEDVAALGYLLNAIAHDLNNLLTNLMLGADQVQYGGGPEAIEVLLEQVQRISGITRSVQRLGQRNMVADEGVVTLSEVFEGFVAWRASVAPDDPVTVTCTTAAGVRGATRHFVHALSLLALATGGPDRGPLRLEGSTEQRPRSAWAGSDDTVPMVVVRLSRGAPVTTESEAFKRLVDGFFDGERSPVEVATMAAWEVVRKARGRMKMRGGPNEMGVEISIELPPREIS